MVKHCAMNHSRAFGQRRAAKRLRSGKSVGAIKLNIEDSNRDVHHVALVERMAEMFLMQMDGDGGALSREHNRINTPGSAVSCSGHNSSVGEMNMKGSSIQSASCLLELDVLCDVAAPSNLVEQRDCCFTPSDFLQLA